LWLSAGILFRFLSTLAEISAASQPITPGNILKNYTNPTNLAVTLIITIVFVVIGYYSGSYLKSQVKNIELQIEEDAENTEKVFNFIENLRSGAGEQEFEKFEDNEKIGKLGKALTNLRTELSERNIKEEKRKSEDSQRNRIAEGMALFGAILRETSDDLSELSSKVISNLVKYIDAQQAGFFAVRESGDKGQVIEQIAAFAYGRKKFSDKILLPGEGLVGACILEKETIFIDKVTENYVEITSGLGKSNPRCILIVPLKTEDGQIHGALEIASFKVYEKFEIEFVERVAESIATTITNLKINMQTSRLLAESREQAKELAAQEEKMRRTVDEMRTLQIEAAQQSEQFVSFTNSVNHTMIRAEYNKEGILTYANTKFLKILGYESNSDVEGKHITTFINRKDQIWFDDLWERLINGGKHFEGDMKHVTKDGKDVWTIATYVSVRDFEGNPEKILFLGIDTTDAKQQSLDYEGQINALNHSSLKAEYMPDGRIIDYNNRLLEALNYRLDEVRDQFIFDFINAEEVDDFKTVWKNILNGIPFEGRIRRTTKNGEEKWFYGSFSIVRDIYDEIAKIIFIGNDITEQRLMETKNKEQTEILKIQEEKLQQAKVDLSRKLKQSREEMKQQFREIETVKLLNEKTLEGMLDAIVTINQDKIVEFFNKAAEELWGLDRDEVLNKDISVLLPEIDETLGDNYLGNYFKVEEHAETNMRREVFILNKDGEQVFVLMTLSEAGIGMRYRLTAFIQRIEVELF
jgi:PAS domain S-box-containing protein